jgi:hypothetical protein
MVLFVVLAGASACGGDEPTDSSEVDQPANGETTAAMADDQNPDAAPEAGEQTAAPASTTSSTTTTAPPQRRMGVVLLAPDEENNKLNMRSGPGTRNPVVDDLLPAQAEMVPTGSVELVDGRLWHELTTAEATGWAYGYYLTETWSPSEIEQEWVWREALESFANALVLGEGLAGSVSWRGLFVIHFDDNLRRWSPEDLGGLQDDDTDLKWANTGASANESEATVGSWKEVIADRFLSDYLDEDVIIEVGGLSLGANAVLPGSAISSAFANFPWVAVHDPGDNPDFSGLDWSTWFIFMELEESGPKIVGIQPQASYP